MRIEQVEITKHTDGWKGTWYKTGQRHFVREDNDWPSVMSCRWRALDVSGGIMDHDCRVVRGPLSWLRCRLRGMRSSA